VTSHGAVIANDIKEEVSKDASVQTIEDKIEKTVLL